MLRAAAEVASPARKLWPLITLCLAPAAQFNELFDASLDDKRHAAVSNSSTWDRGGWSWIYPHFEGYH
jgi:hypothetical protein